MKWITKGFRVCFDDTGEPVALMVENGHDTIYSCKRATVADKDQLLEGENVEPIL